eukprot:TRINITY_DN17575_c0_g1_i2.p1 TRINITY_DN17575_c0_g1~~TRINITY_DN17575_c0_g1_i2.p1  ORF type:complete len:365 (+),score=83.53 TRINITY_DN17575_c0_g1_i2:129-1223(+)
MSYETGDHLAVQPLNPKGLVSELAKRLGLNLKKKFVCQEKLRASNKFPQWSLTPITIERALTQYMDITSVPSRKLLRVLSIYAQDPSEGSQLASIAALDKEGNEKYNLLIATPQRNLLEILMAFPSVNPPFGELVLNLPPLKHRFYSISSSTKVSPSFVHCTVGIVKYTTPLGTQKEGLCSTYLASLSTGGSVNVLIKNNPVRLPDAVSSPVILIGAGTGLAPHRGYLLEKFHQFKMNPDQENGKIVLFFGCRTSKTDFLYNEEFSEMLANAPKFNFQLITAFSRENPKAYVQHKIWENRTLVWEMISQGAYISICGDAKNMAKEVTQTLQNIIQQEGHQSPENAKKTIEELLSTGKYLQDVWG